MLNPIEVSDESLKNAKNKILNDSPIPNKR